MAELPTGLVQVLDRLSSIVRARNAAVLIGLPGAGKTTMLRLLATALGRQGIAVALATPDAPVPSHAGVLLVDDAHRLDPAAWHQVTRHNGALVLAGPPALLDRKPAPRRRTTPVPLAAVPPAEMPLLVAAILRDMNEPASRLPATSVRSLADASGGVPGRAAAIVRMATYLARLEGLEEVERHHVTRAAALADDEADPAERDVVDWAPQRPGRSKAPRTALLFAAAGGLALVALPITLAPAYRPAAGPEAPPVPDRVAADAFPAVFVKPARLPEAPASPLPIVFPLPDPARLHVTVLVASDDAGASLLAASIAGLLRKQGYAVSDLGVSRVHTSALEVRYFFNEDTDAAESLGRIIGANPTAVHLADMAPRRPMRPGSAEVLAGADIRHDH